MADPGQDYRVQGRVPGCPGPFTPPACPRAPDYANRYMDLVFDRVADLERKLPGFSDDAWHLVDQFSGVESSTRDEVRGIALCCAESCNRDAIVPYAITSVTKHVPDAIGPKARQAVADSVLAMLLADVLPVISYAVLTKPLHAAAGSGQS